MTMAVDAASAGHELLLQLAGRLPDEQLWRLRNWLAAGDEEALGAVLPRTLLRHRIGVTERERDLLSSFVPADAPSRRLVDTVLLGRVPAPPDFYQGEPGLADWSAVSIVPGQAREVLLAVREDDARVLLVRGAERPWLMTAALQRLLRVHGERVPRVEAWVGDDPPGPYHEAACAAAVSLWSRSPALAG